MFVESTLATTLGMDLGELRSIVDEGFAAARLLAHEPGDPEKTMAATLSTLRGLHGEGVEARITAATKALGAKNRAQPNGAALLQRVVHISSSPGRVTIHA